MIFIFAVVIGHFFHIFLAVLSCVSVSCVNNEWQYSTSIASLLVFSVLSKAVREILAFRDLGE